jgi:hypothetical protein
MQYGPPDSTDIRKLPSAARRTITAPPSRALRELSVPIWVQTWPLVMVKTAGRFGGRLTRAISMRVSVMAEAAARSSPPPNRRGKAGN